MKDPRIDTFRETIDEYIADEEVVANIKSSITKEDVEFLDAFGGLNDVEIAFLPYPAGEQDNVRLIQSDDALDLAKLLRVDYQIVVALPNASSGQLIQQSGGVSLPELLISAQLILANPNILSIVLNVLSNYIYDGMKKVSVFQRETKLRIYVPHPNGRATVVEFEGNATGLAEVTEILHEVAQLHELK